MGCGENGQVLGRDGRSWSASRSIDECVLSGLSNGRFGEIFALKQFVLSCPTVNCVKISAPCTPKGFADG